MSAATFCVCLLWSASFAGPPVQPDAADLQIEKRSRDHLEQLQRCKEGLVDPDARAVDRQRWAASLLSFDSPQAKALTIELLGLGDIPEVQRALCSVIGDRARRAPERLDLGLIAPLIDLLGAEAEDLRMMAARALADFASPGLAGTLGRLASQSDAPLVKRLAAIGALAPNTHRREVVEQLIRLLDAGVPEITEHVVAALEPVSAQTFGGDVQRWRTWWQEKSRLSEEAWLAEQYRMLRGRRRSAVDELETHLESTRRKDAAVTTKILALQREVYRSLNEDRRDSKLLEWLQDALPEFKRGALSIIKSRIADEGKRPSDDVLATLLALLRDSPAPIRRDVLEVVQNLSDPTVVRAVLEQLDREDDPVTRQMIFSALGQLVDPAALPALIREITDRDSTTTAVREAALALGLLAGKAGSAELLQQAAEALNGRYPLIREDQPALRAALLSAMARVADPSFAPALLDAIESDNAAVLREAIRGLRTIEDLSKLPRMRTLTAHADPLVRLEAIEAVGQLGRELADLERLSTRLNPAEEPNERVRGSAWRGLQAFSSRRPLSERIKVADLLRDTPDLEVRYLEWLADTFPPANSHPEGLQGVLGRLATVLVSLGRHAEAVPHLRSLYDIRIASPGGDPFPAGLRLLDAMLRGETNVNLPALVQQLAETATDADSKARLVSVVASYLDSDQAPLSIERRRALLKELRAVPADSLSPEWTELLDRVETLLEADASPATPNSSSSGS